MAFQDREIEIKFPVDEETFLRVRERLAQTAIGKPLSNQVDTYLTPKHRNFVEPEFPWEWLSVRRRGGKAILCYKHWHPARERIHTHADEFETEIQDPDQLEKIFRALNFGELVTVDKKREIFIFKDEFEIALDDVKGLGFFVEIEALKDLGGVDVTRKKILEFAGSIGIDTNRIDRRGYPFQLMKKKGFLMKSSSKGI
jgi:adenylate cyclase class 2